jgi:prolyl oligopeptidase
MSGLPGTAMTQPTSPAAIEDPYLWLEDVSGERALAWVRARNAETRRVLEAEPGFAATRDRIRAILDSKEKIPQVSRRGDQFYNLWQDEAQPRGLWRRATLAEFRRAAPAWETVLDLDALGQAEGENWVWAGASAHGPSYQRALVSLSRGGADASVVREFDLVDKRFVEGGFSLPEAKSNVEWLDADTIFVGTDFGPGSMTDAGYPRTVRRWQRGQPAVQAEMVFEAQKADVGAWISVDHEPGFERIVLTRAIDFYRSEQFLLQDGRPLKLAKPEDASVSFWRTRVLVELRSDWAIGGRTWPRGSLLAGDAAAFTAGREAGWQALFTPTATRSLAGFTSTASRLVLNVLDNVASRLEEWTPGAAPSAPWTRRDLPAPHPGTLSVQALHDPLLKADALAEQMLVSYTDFLTPDSLMLATAGRDGLETLKSRPRYFDAEGMRVEQRFATSCDGTRVPYFVVWPKGARPTAATRPCSTATAASRSRCSPSTRAAIGSSWLARGGVFVLANIRGGGEFGPGWHQAAVKRHKQKSYDDFIAVAEDLIAAGVTRPHTWASRAAATAACWSAR